MNLTSGYDDAWIWEIRSPSRLRWIMGAEGVLYVGQRVSSGGDFGTIRYVGPVPPTKGEWVGIEWDDSTRGRHDGSKDGVVYFSCKHETGGSFVRPHKLSAGVSVTKALLDRYANSGIDFGAFELEEMYFEDPETLQRTKVEAIGMEEVQKAFRDLQNLRTAGLRMEGISHAGDDEFLLKQAPNIEQLDLSKNLFYEWESIAKICGQLKQLQQLNVSENIMQIPDYSDTLRGNFSSLHTIILNGCQLTWGDVISCVPMWPQIKELHLDKNDISEITPPSDGMFACLTMLNLSSNLICDWKNVSSLSRLPALEKLILDGCGLTEMKMDGEDFLSLSHIVLSNNKFDTTEVFNQLNHLRGLKSMMFRSNPVLCEDTAETMREVIIAKIAKLQMLNRSPIDSIERQGAEMDYLKKNGRYWRESGGHQDPEKNNPSEDFKRDHPRYMELVNIHGAKEDSEFFIKSTALKSNLLDVTIIVPDKPDIKPLKKKLPQSMTVGALKVMISRLLKIPIKFQRLEYVSHMNPNHVVKMDKDSESLYYISLETGDTVRVQKRWSDLDWSVSFY